MWETQQKRNQSYINTKKKPTTHELQVVKTSLKTTNVALKSFDHRVKIFPLHHMNVCTKLEICHPTLTLNSGGAKSPSVSGLFRFVLIYIF